MRDKTTFKVNLGDIRNVENAMRKLSNTSLNDVKSAYWISRLIKKLDSEGNAMEKTRIELITKYGVKDDKGVRVLPENTEKFNEEYAKLLLTEVEIELPLIKFSAIEKMNPTPDELLVLEKFAEDIEAALEQKEATKTVVK